MSGTVQNKVCVSTILMEKPMGGVGGWAWFYLRLFQCQC